MDGIRRHGRARDGVRCVSGGSLVLFIQGRGIIPIVIVAPVPIEVVSYVFVGGYRRNLFLPSQVPGPTVVSQR
jgi:hypothetical protein